MNKQIQQLQDEIDEYIESVDRRVADISLLKLNYEDEITYKINLDPYPQTADSYLSVLNSKVYRGLKGPEPEDIFEGLTTRDNDRIFTHHQSLIVRPQKGFCVSRSLPNPMMDILGLKQQENIELHNKDTLMCLAFKPGVGESECALWQVFTGNEQDWFDMRQPDNLQIMDSTGLASVPWEGSSQMHSIHNFDS